MTPPGERSLFRLFLPSRPLQWFGVAAVLGLMGLSGAALAIAVGLPDLAASQPHPEGWAQLLHLASNRSVAWHAGSAPPPSLALDDPAMIARGATHYGNVCANCHGGPGLGQNPVALSLRPEPPMLRSISVTTSCSMLSKTV
jgi:mono/diheme cytochrome c family protein